MINFVLDELIDNSLAFSHSTISFISFCIMSANVFKHEFEQRAFVSSAYKTKERMLLQFLISFMYIRNKSGPSIEPCGTPVVTFISFDLCCLYLTIWLLFPVNNL